jgi:hypothetical protein
MPRSFQNLWVAQAFMPGVEGGNWFSPLQGTSHSLALASAVQRTAMR